MTTQKLTNDDFLKKLYSTNQYFANGEIEPIEEYINSYTKIKCKCNKCGYIFKRNPSNLYKNSMCPECLRINKYVSNEEFVSRLSSLGNNIISLESYRGANTKIKFQCEFGHIWEAKPGNVLNNETGCPYCTGKKILIGFNDMWTTRPDVAKLLNNPEDGYKYTYSSGRYLDFKCQCCGNIVKAKPCAVSNYGFACNVCSDYVSYPNKFSRAFIKQLPVENFICEYQPSWAKPYSYDNYFEYNGGRYIVEMDGGLHYREGEAFHKPLEDRKRIDDFKTNLAIQNNVNIIRIDCLKSECEYIKNNILTSKLNNIFDLSNIDWHLCDIMAQRRLVKEACDLYISGVKIKEIAKQLCICDGTVRRYIKTGKKIGWIQ